MEIRIGTVQTVDLQTRSVRVFFADVQLMSGWLKVIKNINGKTAQATGTAGEPAHSHSINITPYMPSVDDVVLCIYDSSFNGDGYVLGALK